MTLVTLIGCLAFSVILLFVAIGHMLSAVGGAQQVATPRAAIEAILDTGNVTQSTHFVELGYGAGTVAVGAAKRGAMVGGIDISPLAYLMARWRLRQFKRAHITVGNMFNYDLRDADVVYCYLLPPVIRKLEPVLAAKLSPGTKFVSYAFPLPTKMPTKAIPRTDGRAGIFLYTY